MVKKEAQERDSVFFLKIVIYLILGVMWVQFDLNGHLVPLPFGLIVGLMLAHHEHFTIDRKIEFAILVLASTLSYLFPIGFVLLI